MTSYQINCHQKIDTLSFIESLIQIVLTIGKARLKGVAHKTGPF